MTSEDYKTVLNTVRATMDNALRQNEKLIRGLEYYAGTDWRDLSMVDRGEAARRMINEIMGKEKAA